MKRVLSAMFVLSMLVLVMSGVAEAGDPPAPAPEPVSAMLLAAGAAGLGIRAYRNRR